MPDANRWARWARDRPWLDVRETIGAILVGDGSPAAAEVRVERREISFLLVPIAAAGVGLPELQQRTGDAVAALVEHAAIDEDALARSRFRPALRNCGSGHCPKFTENVVSEDRPRKLGERVVERQQRPLR